MSASSCWMLSKQAVSAPCCDDGIPKRWSGCSAGRRASKLVSLICSCFTGNYVRQWDEYMPHTQLQTTPMFDARAVLYPSDKSLRDYLAWRQADTHVNNQVHFSLHCVPCHAHATRDATVAQHQRLS